MKTKIYPVLLLVLILGFACKPGKKSASGPDAMASHIDSTINPADDFFLYANGKWFKNNPIPASEQSNGLWQLIQDTINEQIRTICVSAASKSDEPKGSNKQKIGDLYFSGMDSVNLNKTGISDLKPEFDRIDAITDSKSLFTAVARLHAVCASPMFGFYVGQDDRLSNKHAVFIAQGGLSLPDRSYYFDTDERTKMIREKYREYVANMFKIMGYDEPKAKSTAERIIKLETAIAKVSRQMEDLRDPIRNYNKMAFADLEKQSPAIDWALFMQQNGLPKVDTVIVGQPEFIKALNGYVKSVPLADWKEYLKFQTINSLASYLDDKTYMERFSFYGKTLHGIEEPRPRWKRVVDQTNGYLGELIGQVYVDEYLPKGTKEKLLEIGNAVKEVYAARIKTLDWMSEETKVKAQKKLSTMIMKVGYPDKWKDLSALNVDRKSYVRNAMNANQWQFNYNIAKYGKPVDRTEWGMYPQTYNAYYSPSNNEICVPGSNIIVPGYERVLADDAILYSIIGGSTFGHEMTHGFDDQGCKYDENGNLNNWWTAEDSIRFYAKTKMIIEQFNEYVAVDSLHINGELTQGENIADLGGITFGLEAFKNTAQFKNKEMIAGQTPEQRFFLAYALAWMINMRPESIAAMVKTDVHSPAKFRVIGPLSNLTEFYTAFGVKEGNAMWRPEEKRVKIW